MIVKERVGNLFSYTGQAIGHGVNCQGVMGAGIAAEFKRRWPGMHESYRQECLDGHLHPGGSLIYSYSPYPFIFNFATQQRPGADARIDWIKESIEGGSDYLRRFEEVSELAIPRIGCGIGGLNWEDVKQAIEEIDVYFTVVVYSLEG